MLVSENVMVCPLKLVRSASTDTPGRTSNVYAVQKGVDEFERPILIAASIFAFIDGPSTLTKFLLWRLFVCTSPVQARLATNPNNENATIRIILNFITTCLCFYSCLISGQQRKSFDRYRLAAP